MARGRRYADEREYRDAADRFVLSFIVGAYTPGSVVLADEDGRRWLCAYSRQHRDGSFRRPIGGRVHAEIIVKLPEGLALTD